jgi:prepilin-type processing-associated H-X9-DG protein
VNDYQLALASHQYHDAAGAFPSGTREVNNSFSFKPLTEKHDSLTWRAYLLPYLEQEAVWNQVEASYRLKQNWTLIEHEPTRTLVLPVFICPTDERVHHPWIVQGNPYSHSSYLGVSGDRIADGKGVLYYKSSVRLTDIQDGTSNTIMIGEKPPSPDMVYGFWYAGVGQDFQGDLDGHMAVRTINLAKLRYLGYYFCPNGPFAYGPGRIDDYCSSFQFWSLHSGGANFAIADGSVRFLNYSADSILPSLATRAGGEVVTLAD